jgi:condensin complex subunit 1
LLFLLVAHLRWMPAAEQAINSIYILADQPDIVCANLVRALTTRAAPPSAIADMEAFQQNSAMLLAQLLFVVGHVAVTSSCIMN